jgi:SOS-response transcriptional repressor LexA
VPPKPGTELTEVQEQVLRAYKAYYDEHGAPPTVRWLADTLEKSHNAVHLTIKLLEKRGDIKHVTIIRPLPPKKRRRSA